MVTLFQPPAANLVFFVAAVAHLVAVHPHVPRPISSASSNLASTIHYICHSLVWPAAIASAAAAVAATIDKNSLDQHHILQILYIS